MASSDRTAPPSPPSSERAGTAEADPGNQTRMTKNGRPMPRRIRAVGDVPGYPPKDALIPGHLTCKEVCEQYPNGLYGEILDPFIHHNWASSQIYDALRQDAKIWMTQNHKDGIRTKNPANALTKRLQKRREKLAKEGTYDALMNATNIRPEGQYQGFQATGHYPDPTAAPNSIAPPNNHQPADPPVINPRLLAGYDIGPQPAAPPVIDPRLLVGYDLGPQPADGMPVAHLPPAELHAPYGGAETDPYWDTDRSAGAARTAPAIPGVPHVYELPQYHETILLSGLGPVPNATHLPPTPNYGEEIEAAMARYYDASWNGPANEGGNSQPPIRASIEGLELPAPPPNSPNQQPDIGDPWAEAAAAADARHYGLPAPSRLQVTNFRPAQTDDEHGLPPSHGVDQWMPRVRLQVPDSNFMYDIKEELDVFQGLGQYQ